MNRPWAASGDADAERTSELRVRGRRETRELLMRNLNELDLILRPPQGTHDSVHAVAGKAVDAVDAPVDQAGDERIADGELIGHDVLERRYLRARHRAR